MIISAGVVVALLAAAPASAGNPFQLEAIGFNAAGTRYGYWIFGTDASTSLSHAELHLVSFEGDTALTTPDVAGNEFTARGVLMKREAKQLETLKLDQAGNELYEGGSAIAMTFGLFDVKGPFEVRLGAEPRPAGTPQPVELIFTRGTSAPEVIYAGADGHAYSLNHVLRPKNDARSVAVIFKLTAEKTDAREYRVALVSVTDHPVAKERKPKLAPPPAITSLSIDATFSREETRGQFAQASALIARASLSGKPGSRCAGKATATFDIEASGDKRAVRKKATRDVELTFDASGKATFEVTGEFHPPLECDTYKVTVTAGCPQATVPFVQKEFLACGV